MIDPNANQTTIVDHLAGERKAFSIEANGKAFKSLISSLYTNKIESMVRELLSNAYDAHVALGNPEEHFEVHLPTLAEPTFKVRDFGVSMTHEQVMDVYTTIFKSTKEDNNSEIGMFGLGSKSPFAYTDHFNVNVYLKNKLRSYLVHVDSNGTPQITFMGESKSQEQRGVEVIVAVNPKDVAEFVRSVKHVCKSFPVVPFVYNSSDFTIDLPMHRGPGWRIYKKHDKSIWNIAFRQGPVSYPITFTTIQSLITDGYYVEVDVAVGTLAVTPSRESLSLDDDTKKIVTDLIASSIEAIKKYADTQLFKNRLDRLQKQTYTAVFLGDKSAEVSYIPDYFKNKVRSQNLYNKQLKNYPRLTYYLVDAKKPNTRDYIFYNEHNYFIIVDPDKKVPRLVSRILQFAHKLALTEGIYRNNVRVFVISREQLPRIYRLTQYPRSHYIPAVTLPDVEPKVKSSAYVSPLSVPAAVAPDKLGPNKYWMHKYGSVSTDFFDTGVKTVNDFFARGQVEKILEPFGINRDDVAFFTDRQASLLELKNKNNLRAVLVKKSQAYDKRVNLTGKYRDHLYQQSLGNLDYSLSEYNIRRFLSPTTSTSGAIGSLIVQFIKNEIKVEIEKARLVTEVVSLTPKDIACIHILGIKPEALKGTNSNHSQFIQLVAKRHEKFLLSCKDLEKEILDIIEQKARQSLNE